jgi:hypothetical protein
MGLANDWIPSLWHLVGQDPRIFQRHHRWDLANQERISRSTAGGTRFNNSRGRAGHPAAPFVGVSDWTHRMASPNTFYGGSTWRGVGVGAANSIGRQPRSGAPASLGSAEAAKHLNGRHGIVLGLGGLSGCSQPLCITSEAESFPKTHMRQVGVGRSMGKLGSHCFLSASFQAVHSHPRSSTPFQEWWLPHRLGATGGIVAAGSGAEGSVLGTSVHANCDIAFQVHALASGVVRLCRSAPSFTNALGMSQRAIPM